MHPCENIAIKGRSWPNFWANLASFSLMLPAEMGPAIEHWIRRAIHTIHPVVLPFALPAVQREQQRSSSAQRSLGSVKRLRTHCI
jgi:hypothetical protein